LTIRLSLLGSVDAFIVFLPTTQFESQLEVAFAYDHLMPKLRKLGDSSLLFNRNFCDFEPPSSFVAELDSYFEAKIMLDSALQSLVVASAAVEPSTDDPIPLKRLRGVLQRGLGFLVRISVPNSEDQALVHHLPQVYSIGKEAALAYDCITRLLLPYTES
jgi:hypothetical protein